MTRELLGSLLVRRGWLSTRDLELALARQQAEGGRLGTCLLEAEAIDERTLSWGLADQLGVAVATSDQLRLVPNVVLDRLPPRIAKRARAIPFAMDEEGLSVALLDPGDLTNLDEVGAAIGGKVKPYLALEIRIVEALERFYDVDAPSRYAALWDLLNRRRHLHHREAGVEVGLLHDASIDHEWTEPSTGAFDEELVGTALAGPSEPATPGGKGSSAPAASAAPKPEQAPTTPEPTPASRTETTAAPPREEQVRDPSGHSLAIAAGILDGVDERDEVADKAIELLLRVFRRVVLFAVRGRRIVGWLGRGPGVDSDLLTAFELGFEQPSILSRFENETDLYRGPLPPMPAHRRLAAVWGGELPRDCLLLPVRVRERMVVVVYGDRQPSTLEQLDLEACTFFSYSFGEALERCILKRKQTL